MNEILISDFFKKEYTQFASYDGYRKIANYIDGLKISQRKILFTLLNSSGDSVIKVDALASKTALDTTYIHGAASLDGVIVNMAIDYPGSNNIPLLRRQGTFGNRLIPVPSASRYIQVGIHPNTKKIFTKADNEIISNQIFEGEEIEPRNYFPRLPMILVNGAEGLAVGFSQNILPRNPENIKKAIELILSGVDYNDSQIDELLVPYFNGFTGSVTRIGKNSFEMRGRIVRDTNTQFTVEEAPVTYNNSNYTKKLETLYAKKVISDYKDLCDTKTDKFKFLIKCDRSLTKKDDEGILKTLSLITSVSEILTTLDENGKIRIFDSANQLLAEWIKVRLLFLEKRINANIVALQEFIEFKTKYAQYVEFIQGDINGFIDSSEKEYLEKMKSTFDDFREDVYNSVVRMQLSSIKKVQTANIPKEIEALNKEINTLNKKLKNLDNVLIEELV